MTFPMRINKYLADSGVASRREADVLIAAGKVLVNGTAATVGQKVNEADEVRLIGSTGKKEYLAYYKGRGIITHSPAPGEVDIASRLSRDYHLANVAPVGRLDKDSEGLIILSNDGRITAPLLNPESGIEKEYEVTVDKTLAPVFARIMEAGVDIEGYRTKPAVVKTSRANPKRFTITITEGKKHQIRRMCAALGYQVESLKRIRIATVSLGKLKPNQFRKLQGEELQHFLTHLGM